MNNIVTKSIFIFIAIFLYLNDALCYQVLVINLIYLASEKCAINKTDKSTKF